MVGSEEVSIHLFKVYRCGYYKRRVFPPVFGSMSDLLQDLHSWIQGKRLHETSGAKDPNKNAAFPVYVSNLMKNQDGDWLLVAWNETPSADGQVASMPANAMVGDNQVVMNDIEENTIPGFATYFWFIPSRSILATIRFKSRPNGQQAMQRYLEDFMRLFSCHVRISKQIDGDGNEVTMMGYAESKDAQCRNDLVPKFRTHLASKPTGEDAIRAEREQIRKLIRKTTLVSTKLEEKTLWQKALCMIGMAPGQEIMKASTRIKYEIEATPTEEELNQIFESWQQNGSEDEWENVGFIMAGRTHEPVWLDSTIVKDKLSLEIERLNPELVSPESLLQQLQLHREHLLAMLAH